MGNVIHNNEMSPFLGNCSYIALLNHYYTEIPGDIDEKFEKLKNMMMTNSRLSDTIEKTGIALTATTMQNFGGFFE